MSDDKMQKIGEIVRKNRKEQGLTQGQLAAISGVGIRFIREVEKGKESCHIAKTLTVLSMLGVDIEINGEKI
jgi:y4mF family transcriptional regulator